MNVHPEIDAPRGLRRRARFSFQALHRGLGRTAGAALASWLTVGACSAGCAERSSQEPTHRHAGGEEVVAGTQGATESPGIADMPYLPVRLSATTARFQRVYRLALLASESPLAPLPEAATRADIDAWTEGVLVPWIALRADILASCRIELNALRAGEPEEHLIAAALMGYLYEDTALQLRGVRIPVADNPRADVRAAPAERIEFLLEQARRAFERCLLAGLGALEVGSYRQYCDDAVDRLGPSSQVHAVDERVEEGATLDE